MDCGKNGEQFAPLGLLVWSMDNWRVFQIAIGILLGYETNPQPSRLTFKATRTNHHSHANPWVRSLGKKKISFHTKVHKKSTTNTKYLVMLFKYMQTHELYAISRGWKWSNTSSHDFSPFLPALPICDAIKSTNPIRRRINTSCKPALQYSTVSQSSEENWPAPRTLLQLSAIALQTLAWYFSSVSWWCLRCLN